MSRKYPLGALLQLRQQIKQQRERQLAEAAQQERQAEEEWQRVKNKVHAKEASLIQAKKSTAYFPSAVAAMDLQINQHYLARLESELAQYQALAKAAADNWHSKQTQHQAAQENLSRAATDLKAVEQNFQRWDQARRKREEQRAEEELGDLMLARHYLRE